VPIEENEPRLGFALDRLAALSDELLAKGYPRERQALVGFSQGACVASEYVFRRKERYGALVAFTGGLVGPPGTQWTAQAETNAFRDMPVLLGGSDVDPWVPASRMLETAEVFRRLGARVKETLYPGMGHEICDEQIADARAILGGLLKAAVH
jgi:predicted esterase